MTPYLLKSNFRRPIDSPHSLNQSKLSPSIFFYQLQVDLYSSMSLRLGAYLDSIDPNHDIIGNTGANPEKVEALGSIPREGGTFVRMICEVRVAAPAGRDRANWNGGWQNVGFADRTLFHLIAHKLRKDRYVNVDLVYPDLTLFRLYGTTLE